LIMRDGCAFYAVLEAEVKRATQKTGTKERIRPDGETSRALRVRVEGRRTRRRIAGQKPGVVAT